MAGVDTDGCRVAKSRGTSDLPMERPEVGRVVVGALLEQANRWIQQCDRLVGGGSNGHLRRSTPARTRGEGWRQGVWARQQLMNNGHTIGKG